MKKIWQLLQESSRRWIAAGACVAAVLAAVGIGSLAWLDGKNEAFRTDVTTKNTETDTQIEDPMQELPVSEEEAVLLLALYRAMSEYDYDEAAAILNEHEEQFRILTEETLGGSLYYYMEERVGAELEEHVELPPEESDVTIKMGQVLPESAFVGMVLTRYNTVFYGMFEEGKPNGAVSAIQTIVLDQPRYSYAEGSWRDGTLNGEGTAGYYYYKEAPETGFVRVEKCGSFHDNLLDSDFVYKTESGSGEQLSWRMRAENGVTVITDDWEHYPYRKEYMLGSVEDSGRAYVLSEDKVTEVLWNNLIVWPEQTALK